MSNDIETLGEKGITIVAILILVIILLTGYGACMTGMAGELRERYEDCKEKIK